MPITYKNLGTELCDALQLNVDHVRAITIHCEVGQEPTVTVEMVQLEPFRGVGRVLRRYELVERA